MTDKEAGKVMEQFFQKEMPPSEFAKLIRIHLHEVLLQYFVSADDDVCHKKTMYEGYFWLTLFCEKIDPILGIYEEN